MTDVEIDGLVYHGWMRIQIMTFRIGTLCDKVARLRAKVDELSLLVAAARVEIGRPEPLTAAEIRGRRR